MSLWSSGYFFDFLAKFGSIKLNNTLVTSIMDMVHRVTIIENCSSNNSFTPINIKIIAIPCCKKVNLWMLTARKKYKALSPKIAKIFDVKIINGSFKIERIAGMLSVANMTSLISIKIIAKNNGVAYIFLCLVIKNCSLVMDEVVLKYLLHQRTIKLLVKLFFEVDFLSLENKIFPPEKIKNTPNKYNIQCSFAINHTPPNIIKNRNIVAPIIP